MPASDRQVTGKSDLQVVVIGAGAAGVAAARELARAGLCVRVLEGRKRVGGRAWTRPVEGYPLDMGCGWLHSADENILAKLARTERFTIDDSLPPWTRRERHNFPSDELARFQRAQADLDARIEAAAASGPDAPASALLDPACDWNGLLDAVSTYVNGVELDRLSIRDANAYRDTGVNHRVVEGLGALIAALARPLTVTTGFDVAVVDHSGADIAVSGPAGVLHCDAVVVTAPTAVLAFEQLRFIPALPDRLDAAANLPLGTANKMFLRADPASDLPDAGFLFGARDRAATGSYHVRPLGRPLIEAYFGGAFACELERAGADAMASVAIDEICANLGGAWRSKLRPIAASAWVGDPYAGGSYSAARPGHADKRAILAAPHEGRIFFAGEATSPQFFSTVHGAFESGLRAARQILATIR